MVNNTTTLKDTVDALSKKKSWANAQGAERRTEIAIDTQTAYDAETGEILDEKVVLQTRSKGTEPSFVKLYLNDLMLLNDLPTKATGLLWELMKVMSYENKIILNGAIKKQIAATLDIKMPTLNNTLSSFVKKEILYRIDTGIYTPNPYLFAKGNWSDIKELRMNVTYTPAGEKLITSEANGLSMEEFNNIEIEEM